MPKRTHSPRARSFRPEADGLETRQLLSAVVTGTDIDGDTWTLRLIGPGDISVQKQDDSSGNPSPLNSQTEINTITVGGTNPLTSRLVGTVNKGPNGDGQVFFQNLIELPAHSAQFPVSGLGLLSINMPGFYLGNTTPASSVTTANPSAPSISLPDGADTFNFGGVDMTHDPFTPVSGTTSINAIVQLGLPPYGGSRVIVNKTVSTHQSIAASSGTTPTTVQEGVIFAVSGRLDLFQANEIDGDAALPPGQFTDINSAATGTGGTMIVDTQPGVGSGGFLATSSFFSTVGVKGAIGGQIGDVRIGGNATNFTTIVADPAAEAIDKISNYSIGGQSQNVMLVAPNGARNIVFGQGMDTAEVYTHVVNTIKANRGALNSNIFVDRTISNIQIGGDVNGTNVESGYNQNYNTILSNILGAQSGTPTAPPKPLNAMPFGGMEVHIAGDVTNSVFAASVHPFQNVFGGPNQLVLPGGHIGEKVEGTIDNSTATPSTPNQAFFAQSVTSYVGPVVPPNVPEAPYPQPKQPVTLPGIANLSVFPTIKVKTPTASTTNAAKSIHATATPKGPAQSSTTKTKK